jgi:hypothetical protein
MNPRSRFRFSSPSPRRGFCLGEVVASLGLVVTGLAVFGLLLAPTLA